MSSFGRNFINKCSWVIYRMAKKKKEGSFKIMMIVMVLSLIIAGMWDKIAFLKEIIHSVLDPTAGFLLNWDLTFGMLIIVFVISLITTLVQKYATDQDALKELKAEQKILQEEMKKYKDHPEKVMELQKKQFEFIPKTMKLSTRAMAYTSIPFILFFRWFNDYFAAVEEATGMPVRFFGFFGWFIFYFITTIIFSSILKKKMDVV